MPNPVARAALETDHLLPPQEDQCPPDREDGDDGVNDHDHGGDHLNQHVIAVTNVGYDTDSTEDADDLDETAHLNLNGNCW